MAVIIEPDKGEAAEIGRQLLALADSPRDVQWTSWPVAGFLVPEELALRLKDIRDNYPAESAERTEKPEAPRQRRAGRPRKPVETVTPVLDTDDTAKEE